MSDAGLTSVGPIYVREHKTQVDNCGKDASWLIREGKVSG